MAQVTVLDKQQGSFKQVTAPGAVKNDLVINAYKPRAGFTQRFISTAGQGLEADFVRQHLQQLPLAANAERSREMLYSKYLAYYVQHGYQVAYNGDQFYRALGQWGCVERDGYWFADEAQANEYEKRQAGAFGGTTKGKRGTAQAQAVLFISDERSARQWLWNFLATPQSYSDIYTAYSKALQTSEDELPEPRTMLEEGFISVGSQWRRPDALTQAELDGAARSGCCTSSRSTWQPPRGADRSRRCARKRWLPASPRPIAPAATPISWPWAASCPSGCWRIARIFTISWISPRRRWKDNRRRRDTRS